MHVLAYTIIIYMHSICWGRLRPWAWLCLDTHVIPHNHRCFPFWQYNSGLSHPPATVRKWDMLKVILGGRLMAHLLNTDWMRQQQQNYCPGLPASTLSGGFLGTESFVHIHLEKCCFKLLTCSLRIIQPWHICAYEASKAHTMELITWFIHWTSCA